MKATRSSYAAHAEEVEARIKRQNEQLRNILSEWAAKESPLKRGDRTTVPDREWHFPGKTARVQSVSVGRSSIHARDREIPSDVWCWKVTAIVLNKNGEPMNDSRAWATWELPMNCPNVES